MDFAYFPPRIGDEPAAGQQLHGQLAPVADRDRIGKHEALVIGVGLIGQVARFDPDLPARPGLRMDRIGQYVARAGAEDARIVFARRAIAL